MCCAEKKSGCQCPDELKGKPEECHGTTEEHPCVSKEEKK
jgi:hypothetical protein